MGVSVGPDETLDRDAVAADIFHEIAENGKARNHIELLLRPRRSGSEERRERSGGERASGQHGISFMR